MSAMDRTSEDFSELLCSFEQRASLRLLSLRCSLTEPVVCASVGTAI